MQHDPRFRAVRPSAWRLLAGAALASGLSACRGNVTNPFGDEGQLTTITVSGDSVVQVGDTARLSARGKVAGIIGLLTYDRVLDAHWTVSDQAIARLTPIVPPAGDTTSTAAALVTGVRPGTVQVTATARGVSGSASVRVVAASSTVSP